MFYAELTPLYLSCSSDDLVYIYIYMNIIPFLFFILICLFNMIHNKDKGHLK